MGLTRSFIVIVIVIAALKTMETLTSTSIKWKKVFHTLECTTLSSLLFHAHVHICAYMCLYVCQWSIDANAAWTPAVALEFLDRIQSSPFRDMIYMVEQPFPLELINVCMLQTK
jgi:hypothetical protein